MAFVWQELRDDATYVRTAYDNEQQRKTTLYATALANDVGEGGNTDTVDSLIGLVDGIYDGED